MSPARMVKSVLAMPRVLPPLSVYLSAVSLYIVDYEGCHTGRIYAGAARRLVLDLLMGRIGERKARHC